MLTRAAASRWAWVGDLDELWVVELELVLALDPTAELTVGVL
jgi:hypothetical protein